MKNELNIQQVNWNQVADVVKNLDPCLHEIVENWPKAKKFPLFLAEYSYGSKILKHGRLHLPLKNRINEIAEIPLNNSDMINKKLQNSLSYSSCPIGLILNKTVEVFYEFDNSITSLAHFTKGVPLGLLETLEPEISCCLRNVWDVTAGARSTFMLPKISERTAHSRLEKTLGFSSALPRRIIDHYHLFYDLINAEAIASDWKVQILFFSREWLTPNKQDPDWLRFHHYLHEYLFRFSGFSRNKPTFDLVWHFFSLELKKKGKKLNPYIMDTLKHLISISLGVAPGFSPQENDESGPFSKIQELYQEIYSIEYIPTIMGPRHFLPQDINNSIYYSMKYPYRFESLPQTRKSESIITDLYQTRSLSKDFFNCLHGGKLKLENTLMNNILKSIKFEYYHINPNEVIGIKESSTLIEDDPRITSCATNKINKDLLKFASSSSFFTGCVRITKDPLIANDDNKRDVPLS